MSNRTDPGANVPDTTWSWDTGANGIGQLGSVTGPNSYSEQYGYGAANTAGAGKVTSTVTTVSGTAYEIDTSYDPKYAKEQTITYPTSTSGRFAVTYDYNSFGYAIDVKGASGSTAGKIFWQANALDARGHVTQATLGNGLQTTTSFDKTTGLINSIKTGAVGGETAIQNLSYSWDRVGNLLRRSDNNQNLAEAFTYDNLYRLQNVTLNGTSTLTMSYDALGNVTSKSDVGAYDYTSTQSGCSYTGLTAQPHAVRKAGSNVYCYDADGNLTSRNGASVSWYPYNQPQSINQVGGNYSTFYYAPDRSRYLQTSLNGTVTESRFYIGGIFEKMISSDATVGTEYRHYIVANGQKVAFQVISASRNSTVYFQDDHLGSTDVMTGQDGTAQVRESYDAWGKRRGSAWSGTPSSSDLNLIGSASHIGYTGQEHLDNLGLVDLNGRVYDPVIARFMSADPSIQAPRESQSLNRYSYTWNNPLNHTDPTGYETCTGTHIDFDVANGPPAFCANTFGLPTYQTSALSSGGAPGMAVRSAPAAEAPSGSAQVTSTTPAAGQQEADQISDIVVQGTRAQTTLPSNWSSCPGCTVYFPAQQEPISEIKITARRPSLHSILASRFLEMLSSAWNVLNPHRGWNTGVVLGGPAGAAGVAAEATEAAREAGTIDTALVRFTQSSVSQTFKDGRNINDVAAALRGAEGDALAEAIPPIRIFERDGNLFTLDNRRLLTFSIAGREVPFVRASAEEVARESWKVTATPEQLGGWYIRVK